MRYKLIFDSQDVKRFVGLYHWQGWHFLEPPRPPPWNVGILEYWDTGILECWNIGILESLNFQIFKSSNLQIFESCNLNI